MYQTDVSFKQSRRRRKKVDPDEDEDGENCVPELIPSPASDAASDLGSKPFIPITAKPTRKAALPWRSTAARRERDALVKFYEEISKTRDVITPEPSESPATAQNSTPSPVFCVQISDSSCGPERSSPVPGARPSYPSKGSPQACRPLQQGSISDSEIIARVCLPSTARAGSPLPFEDLSLRPIGSARNSLQVVSTSSLCAERAAKTSQDGIAGPSSKSHDGSPFSDGSSSACADCVECGAASEAAFVAADAHSPRCESQRTPPGTVSRSGEQDVSCSTSSPLGQTSACSTTVTVSLDTENPGMPSSSGSRRGRHSLLQSRDVMGEMAQSDVEPGACASGVPSSETAAQPTSAAGDTCQVEHTAESGGVSGSPVHDVLPVSSNDGAEAECLTPSPVPASALGACLGTGHSSAPIASPIAVPGASPGASPSCSTPCLRKALADSPTLQQSGSVVQSSAAMPSLQRQSSAAEGGSPQRGRAGTTSALAHSGQPKRTSGRMQSVHSAAEDVFATPQLSVSFGEDNAKEPTTSASPANKTSAPPNEASDAAAAESAQADHAPVQPRTSLWGPASHMPGQHRRAKARASVAYARHSVTSFADFATPCGARSGQTGGTRRPRGSLWSSVAPCHPCQLALPDAHLSPGLSCVEAIPEARSAGADEDLATSPEGSPAALSAFEHALRACGQNDVGDFTECMQQRYGGTAIKKLGEGTFKEVYLCGNDVVSVIPIEGDIVLNDEKQPSAMKVLPELVAHELLSRLREPTAPCGDTAGPTSQCSAFVDVMGCMILRGKYYMPFKKAWKHFKKTDSEAENEDPTFLPQDQLFLILISENGGNPLEHVHLYSFEEAKSIMLQMTLALAVAETCHEFEHRDLHWGNILIQSVDQENEVQCFLLDDEQYMVHSHGNKVCIIDFTLCRLTSPDGEILTSRLDELDWLFNLDSGLQGDAYRRMKTVAEKVWKRQEHPDLGWAHFTPGTNVAWIEYMCGQLQERVFVKEASGELSILEMKKKDKQSWEAFRRACRSERYGKSCKHLLKHPFLKSAFVKS